MINNIDKNKLRVNTMLKHSEILDFKKTNPIRVNVKNKDKEYVIADLLPAESKLPTIIGCRVDNKNDLLETLIIDGALAEDETFDARINRIIRNDLFMIKNKSNLNTKANIMYIADAKANFDFKIYVVDCIMKDNKGNNTKICRQLKAFFLEEKYNEVYQLTIRSKMCKYPTEEFTIGKFNKNGGYDRDLMAILQSLMASIDYAKNVDKF